jgi:hypothetical protein
MNDSSNTIERPSGEEAPRPTSTPSMVAEEEVRPQPLGSSLGFDPAAWLLRAAGQSPQMHYAIVAVGIAAAAAIALGFFFGNFVAAIFGSVVIFGAMVLFRVYAVSEWHADRVDVSLAIKVLIWLFVLALGSLIVVGVVAFSAHVLGITFGSNINITIAEMNKSFATHRWKDADYRANQVLQAEPNNATALNVKGAVSFYEGNYAAAVDFFNRAVKQQSEDRVFLKNLADAHLENGNVNEAITIYVRLEAEDSMPERQFDLARAYLYADKFDEALERLRGLNAELYEGHAKVVEAAALAGLALEAQSPIERETLLQRARDRLSEGMAQDAPYWNAHLTGKKRDPHVGYQKVIDLLNRGGLLR